MMSMSLLYRRELYCQSYESVNWVKARNQCAQEDLYYPRPFIQNVLWWTLYQAEGFLLSKYGAWLRRKALNEVMSLIKYEDENTRYIDIGPVNKTINMVCCWLDDPSGEAFKRYGASKQRTTHACCATQMLFAATQLPNDGAGIPQGCMTIFGWLKMVSRWLATMAPSSGTLRSQCRPM
jgi:hypothetical protein